MKTKIIYEFEQDESYERKVHQNAMDFVSALHDIAMHIRTELKHGSPSAETERHLEKIQEIIVDSGYFTLEG